METYVCGSTACLAGWTVALASGHAVGDNLEPILHALHADSFTPLTISQQQYLIDLNTNEAYKDEDGFWAEWALETALLNVSDHAALSLVFVTMDHDEAVESFKILCGIAEDSA